MPSSIRPSLLILQAKCHFLSVFADAKAATAAHQLLLAVKGSDPAVDLDLAGSAASY